MKRNSKATHHRRMSFTKGTPGLPDYNTKSGLSSLIPNTDTSISIIQVELPAFSIIKPDVLPGLLFPGFLTGSETVALWECFGMRLRGGGFVVI